MLRLCLQLEIVTNVVKHRKKRRLTFISLNCKDFYVFNRSARWYIYRPSTYEEDSSFPTSEFPQVDPRNLGCRISGSKQKHWEHISLCLQKQEIQTLLHICNRLQSWYAWYVYIYMVIIYIHNHIYIIVYWIPTWCFGPKFPKLQGDVPLGSPWESLSHLVIRNKLGFE